MHDLKFDTLDNPHNSYSGNPASWDRKVQEIKDRYSLNPYWEFLEQAELPPEETEPDFEVVHTSVSDRSALREVLEKMDVLEDTKLELLRQIHADLARVQEQIKDYMEVDADLSKTWDTLKGGENNNLWERLDPAESMLDYELHDSLHKIQKVLDNNLDELEEAMPYQGAYFKSVGARGVAQRVTDAIRKIWLW